MKKKIYSAEAEKMTMALLLTGASTSEVSASTGISRDRIREWRASPRWASRFAAAQRAMLGEAHDRLAAAAAEAVGALAAIARDDREQAKDRIAASVAILDRVGLHSRSSLEVSRGPDAPAPDVSSLSDADLAALSAAAAIERKLLGG